jgi:hypothetical protein
MRGEPRPDRWLSSSVLRLMRPSSCEYTYRVPRVRVPWRCGLAPRILRVHFGRTLGNLGAGLCAGATSRLAPRWYFARRTEGRSHRLGPSPVQTHFDQKEGHRRTCSALFPFRPDTPRLLRITKPRDGEIANHAATRHFPTVAAQTWYANQVAITRKSKHGEKFRYPAVARRGRDVGGVGTAPRLASAHGCLRSCAVLLRRRSPSHHGPSASLCAPLARPLVDLCGIRA